MENRGRANLYGQKSYKVDYKSLRTISCLKVSCKLLWSVVNVLRCITSVKSAAISFPFKFSWLRLIFFLAKQHWFKACLNSGIRNAYTTGLIKELEKYIKKVTRKMLSDILYLRKSAKFQTIGGSQEIKDIRETNIKAFVKRLFCKALLCKWGRVFCWNFLQIPMFRPQIVRTKDKPYKHSPKNKSTTLTKCRRKTVKIEPRILKTHGVKITSLYARAESVRCFSGQ